LPRLRFSPGSLRTTAKARRAAQEFGGLVGEVINATVSKAPIAYVEVSDSPEFDGFVARAPNRTPDALPLNDGRYLYLIQRLGLRRDEKYLTTLEYRYVYQATQDPDSWIFRYEYQREPAEGYPYPVANLQINASPDSYAGDKRFRDLHLPTGRVTIEDIVRHLIDEHGLEPVSDDWGETLSATEESFKEIQRKRFRD
jgi:hypothetical protein